ncbi:MAG: type II toxin-antitoxin system VapC family toxin [Bifidobacteriaceae bacterium]|jgi:predicted nucleic acid-binding protein|nr:type II toxin-antitoxin system VapC family toxin [Bifidobacteriaceae bacterium]
MSAPAERLAQGLLDTSVFIAAESGRPLDAAALPDQGFVSVITAAELEAGVHAAGGTETRARRLLTYQAAMRLELLPVDAVAAHHWATLRYRVAEAGGRINVNDLWIAAIALARGLPVVTQDDDFEALRDLGGPGTVRV